MAENSILESVSDFYLDSVTPPVIRLAAYSAGSSYTHKLLVGNGNTTILTLNVGSITPRPNSNMPTIVDVSLTSAQLSTLGAAFPNVATFIATFTLQTYNNNTQIGGNSSVRAKVMVSEANSSPTMGSWSYSDVSTEGYAITSDRSKIVNGVSNIRFSGYTATPKFGATIVRYGIIAITGESTSTTSSTCDWVWSTNQNLWGNYSTGANIAFTITAYDSRGFSCSVTQIVTTLPYEPLHVFVSTIKRNSTTPTRPAFIVDGDYARVGSNGLTATYKYREAGVSTWTDGGSLTVTVDSGGVITNRRGFHLNTTATGVNLAEDRVYVIQLTIQDKAGSAKEYTQIAYLTPLHMHLSFRERSLGIGGVPTGTDTVEIDAAWKLVTKGKMDTGSAKYYRSGDYSINMRDSDIIGANGIYFYDLADARDEGLVFPRTVANKWDTFYVADGDAYIRRNHDIDAFVAGVRLLTADDLSNVTNEIYYKNGDTYTVSAGILMGHITSAYKAIRLALTVPKSLANITSVTVNTMTGTMRGNKGYLDSNSSDRNWLNLGTVTANIVAPNMLRINIDTTNAISNVDLNTPVEFYSATNGISLTFNA